MQKLTRIMENCECEWNNKEKVLLDHINVDYYLFVDQFDGTLTDRNECSTFCSPHFEMFSIFGYSHNYAY